MKWDNFCEDEFWNSSLTWYTEDPKFTQCFEKSVLVWIPCLFLWIFSPLEIYFFLNSKQKNVPWNWLNISKLLIASILTVILAGDLSIYIGASIDRKFIYSVNFYAPFMKCLTVAYSGILVFYNRKYGMHTSGLMLLFWCLLMFCGIPEFRTVIRDLQSERVLSEMNGNHVIYVIYYPLVVFMFLLNCPSDKPPKETLHKKTQNPCPELRASFLSKMLFSWFDDLIIQGYKKPLEQKDLWDISPDNSVKEIFSQFDNYWENSISKCRKKKRKGSFLGPLFKTFAGMFFVSAGYRVINDLMIFVNPILLGYMISYVQENQETWKGILYAILLFLSVTFKTFISQQFTNRNLLISMRIRSALVPLIYKKALVMSNTARKKNTLGEIMNLMAIDTQRFGDVGNTINTLWSSPLQIILSTYFLWQELGPSVLAGFVVLILLIPTNAVIANYSKRLQIKIMKQKDERVKIMNEILNGIRILKLYAWEKSFEEQITNVREKELKLLKKSRYLEAVTTFILYCSPIMVALASFTTYVFVDEKNVLDASKTFVSLSLFNIMRNPLQNLPNIISNILQMFVSVKRINNFLNAQEMDPDVVQHERNKEYPVTIENGTFSWGEYPILKNINLRLKFNTLTAVVGSVGAGKSSLLCAIMGEMDKINGNVNNYGKIAYVPQQAWIQNATLRDNILFGKAFDKRRYDEVIEACALKTDFEILPAGDQTEIGEKGINLSGGQKQRVSLARAVYADADLYLLDDPLSAVDSHVGKHIFNHVIGPKGYLRYKTKFLITHAVTYLPQAHQIVVMKDGCMSETGTYQELLNKGGDFADFLKQHVINECDEELEYNEPQLDQNTNRLSSRLSQKSLRRSDLQSNGSIVSYGKVSIKDELELKKGERLIEKEKAEIGNVKWDIYKYYLENVGFQMILIIFVIQVLTQVFEIASNAWLGQWSEDKTLVLNGTVNIAKRDMYLGVYGAMGLGQALTIISSNVIYTIATLAAALKIHQCLLENTLRLPMYFFDVTPIGRILGRFSSDMSGVDSNLPSTFQNFINNTLKVCGTMGVIIYTTPLFLTVILPLFVIYYVIQRVYIATSRQLRRLVSISRSPLFSHFGETLTGLQTIRAYGQQKRFTSECHVKIDVSQSGNFCQMTSNRWLSVRLEFIGNLIVFFAALFAALAKNQSPALVGLSVSYSLQIIFTFKMLVNMVSNVETDIVSVERIKEYQDSEKEAAWEKPDNTPKFWPERGMLSFKNYGVRYREGLDLVLKDVNLHIEPGSNVGVVGRTGAGKSSMTLGLFRLVEAVEGQIEIDGVNIAELGLEKLRSALTIIPQDPVLFAGTLRINLDPFSKHSDQELWRTLELAHLKHFVDGLPEGLQHEITEGGQNLSAGQKQLICLARALLRKTKILILDEATAAIDLETDDLLQETIRREFKDCTVLTIAHRLNTIMDSDRIVVLDKGRIVEYDSPNNLIADNKSIFHRMCKDAGLC